MHSQDARGRRDGNDLDGWLEAERDQLRPLLLEIDLPVGKRLRTRHDVGDVGVNPIRAPLFAGLALFGVLPPRKFLLAPFVQRLFTFSLGCSGS